VGRGPQDRELVAAEPRHHVAAAHPGAEPPGDFLQELVAGMVAERVVDHLELVDVENASTPVVPEEQRGSRASEERCGWPGR
jgi:hypothetical protein